MTDRESIDARWPIGSWWRHPNEPGPMLRLPGAEDMCGDPWFWPFGALQPRAPVASYRADMTPCQPPRGWEVEYAGFVEWLSCLEASRENADLRAENARLHEDLALERAKVVDLAPERDRLHKILCQERDRAVEALESTIEAHSKHREAHSKHREGLWKRIDDLRKERDALQAKYAQVAELFGLRPDEVTTDRMAEIMSRAVLALSEILPRPPAATFNRWAELIRDDYADLHRGHAVLHGAIGRLGAEVDRLSAKQREVDRREGEVSGLKALLAKSHDAEDQAKRESATASEHAYKLERELRVEQADRTTLGKRVGDLERDLEQRTRERDRLLTLDDRRKAEIERLRAQHDDRVGRVADLERDLEAMDRVVMRANERVAKAEALAAGEPGVVTAAAVHEHPSDDVLKIAREHGCMQADEAWDDALTRLAEALRPGPPVAVTYTTTDGHGRSVLWGADMPGWDGRDFTLTQLPDAPPTTPEGVLDATIGMLWGLDIDPARRTVLCDRLHPLRERAGDSWQDAAKLVRSLFDGDTSPTTLRESPELVTMQARGGGADGGLVRIEVHPPALHVRLIVSENVVAGVRVNEAVQLRRKGWTVDVFAVAADSLGWRAR